VRQHSQAIEAGLGRSEHSGLSQIICVSGIGDPRVSFR
jgi:hypothetical protein